MLIVLLFFALFQTLQCVPLPSPTNPLNDFSTFFLRDTESQFGERTVRDIIISCFVTIFACTWSAIHPNIPAPTDGWWTRFKRQVVTMIYALLAPELITYWALEQRLFRDSPSPSLSKSSMNRPRWTITHGFFLQMGGFMLSEDGRPIHVLIDGSHQEIPKKLQLIYNIEKGIISPPRITEEDIQDRSKGDIISKTIIILQTTWFIIQCLARWFQHLPLTELEIITLGFAMLNGITYALWWNKPQNVNRPVFLERERPIPTSGEKPKAIDQLAMSTTVENIVGSLYEPETERQPTNKQEGFLKRNLRKSYGAFEILLMWLLRPLVKLIVDEIAHTDRVSIFYRSKIKSEHEAVAAAIMVVIGTLFGGVHLIPSWFLDFASPQEMWLWRTCAIFITVVPLTVSTSVILHRGNMLGSVRTIIAGAAFVFTYLYPFARIILLITSLTYLHSLSPPALQTIKWTTVIPHL
ncbi:hypothetical protein BDN70DRAFT_978161 [Pholiota conissans]|uniref:Uncharacterized protein n=1 Tax=Pholiota conissans TaxID=109636 RepID=A0A9P6CRJ8_9AGAR|nr:hypothetical protein BDN70DRAFT_978161 [Pholiota conissans]